MVHTFKRVYTLLKHDRNEKVKTIDPLIGISQRALFMPNNFNRPTLALHKLMVTNNFLQDLDHVITQEWRTYGEAVLAEFVHHGADNPIEQTVEFVGKELWVHTINNGELKLKLAALRNYLNT